MDIDRAMDGRDGARGMAEELAAQLAACDDPSAQLAAGRALASLGCGAASAAPALTQLMRTGTASSAALAAFVLGEIGPAALEYAEGVTIALAEALAHEDGEVRHWAASALGRLGEAAQAALPRLLEALDDEDEAVSISAMHALHELGPSASSAIPQLVEAMRHSRHEVRRAAAKALARVDPKGALSGGALRKGLASWPHAARLQAIRALFGMQADQESLAEALRAELASHDPRIRHEATELAGRLRQPPPPLVRQLGLLLRDPAEAVRYEAAQALLCLGGGAAPAGEPILEALDDGDPDVRGYGLAILESLVRAGERLPAAASDGILRLMDDYDAEVRIRAVKAASMLLTPGEPKTHPWMMQGIRQRLYDTDACVRIIAAKAVLKGGDPFDSVAGVFDGAFRHGDLRVQSAALHALILLGAAAREARPIVAAHASHANPYLRDLVRETLSAIGGTQESGGA